MGAVGQHLGKTSVGWFWLRMQSSGAWGRAAGGWTGIPLQSQTSPRVLTLASLGFPTAWLPPGSQTAHVVAEGVMDSVPVTEAEATWLF